MPSGWAESPAGEDKVRGPFSADMPAPDQFLLIDMPVGKPVFRPPHIKGVPGATSDADEDHQPGGGVWKDVQ